MDHNQNGDNTFTDNTQGTWALDDISDNNPLASYSVSFSDEIVLTAPTVSEGSITGTTVNLTNNELLSGNEKGDGTNRDFTNAMLLMPQTMDDAWAPKATTPSDDDGSYLELNCEIYNIAGTAYVQSTDVKLYNGKIRIPLTGEWKQGIKYVYTFVFTKDGDGGYGPEGDDVLVPIEYEVTVDDFTNEKNTDVNVDQGTTAGSTATNQ